MKQTSFTTTILKADNGKYLTQTASVDIRERIIAKEVALGKNDVPANWREISDAEKDMYERQLKAANESDKRE